MIFSILLPKFKPRWDNILNQIDDEIHHLVLNDLGMGLLAESHMDGGDSDTQHDKNSPSQGKITPKPQKSSPPQQISVPEFNAGDITKMKEQTLKSEKKNKDLLTKLDDYESELEQLRAMIEKLTYGNYEKDRQLEELEYQVIQKDITLKELEQANMESTLTKKNTDRDEEEYRDLIAKYNEQ